LEKEKLFNLAMKLEKAGSCLIVLECISEKLAKKISINLKIPTIGIGASLYCDGQVLVTNDILETTEFIKKPRFIKSYEKLHITIDSAVKKYCIDVVKKKFPKKKNTYL
jgi:3-methyl-2-oxobutanoate hydroxymethyltransferase